MKMSIRKRLLILLALCSVAMIAFTGLFMNVKSASADPIIAQSSDFYMGKGAVVRTAPDDMGIRFKATITESYWNTLLDSYGQDATYNFYSIVTDGTKDIRKDYENLTPDFTEADTYELYSSIIYNTQQLEDAGLLDSARSLKLCAKTYLEVTKANESTPVTISAFGETGYRSMRAIANDYVLQGLGTEELEKYIVVGNRSEKSEGYVFADNTGIIEMAALPDLSEATDMEVYFGAEQIQATYADGVISFSGVVLEENQTDAYISVFMGGKVYSSKVTLATKITQSNVTDLLSLTGDETVYLAEDVDLSGITWNTAVTFSGVLDGGNHAIKNLTAEASNGFFKDVNGATIKNVAFTNVDLSSGSTGTITYRPTGGLTVNNVFIQVAKTPSLGRVGAICERSGNQVALNLIDVVIFMPYTNSNEAIYGYQLSGMSLLTNVHCIGLPNATASIGNVAANLSSSSTYTLHVNLDAFNSAEKDLTKFMTYCVNDYLN